MTLEVAYWIALGAGVAFLLLAVVLGDVFDFLDFLNLDVGNGFAATPVFFTAVAAFGGGGLLALGTFETSRGVSVLAGLGTSVVAGGLAAVLFALLRRQEMVEGFNLSQLVGARGRCTLAITPGKEGRVSIQHSGMTRSIGATSSEAIATGDEIVVVDVIGSSVTVSRPAQTST